MQKYVAFIDILGFKEKLKSINQNDAEKFIGEFSSMLYREWQNSNHHQSKNICGLIISDSIIVYTKNDFKESLNEIIMYIMKIFKKAFSEKGVLLRGAIAKGEFNQLETYSFNNLQKGLIVGQAYIEAYTMESTRKGSLIVLSSKVKDDMDEYYANEFETAEIKTKDNTIYSLKWANIDYLLENKNIEDFVRLAHEAKWLPHYYETLYMFFTNENNKKKNEVLTEIYQLIKTKYQWPALDLFIEKAFSQEVDYKFQRIILKFIRNNIQLI